MRQVIKTMCPCMLTVALGVVPLFAWADQEASPPTKPRQTEKTFDAPDGLKMTVRTIGSYRDRMTESMTIHLDNYSVDSSFDAVDLACF